MLRPQLPSYDIETWQQLPFPERLRLACVSWAEQGYGTPLAVYLAYVLKIAVYVLGWALVVVATSDVGGLRDIGSWWASEVAFKKAVLWTVAWEGLGLGCGSGPLTGRYLPPIGGVLYFLRPGTLKLPLRRGLPILGRPTRSAVDIVIYLGLYAALIRALVSPQVGGREVVPVIAFALLLGVADKVAFLALRPDHYLVVLTAFAFADWLPATKIVWAAVWFWAATSKLNRHFPSVVAVMVSNSPTTRRGPFRRWMYRRFPDDLRPSRLAKLLAHGGTAIEYLFPLGLLLGTGGTLTKVALAAMVAFHLFITTSVPMGVPIEWNLMMVYGGFVLFGHHADVRAWDVRSPLLAAALLLFLVVLPVVGNLWPHLVSFLFSMRYYAGNWAYSVWLFRDDAAHRLDRCLTKPSPHIRTQLARLYDDEVIGAVASKVMAFRAMHLHGRALQLLLPKAVDDIDRYEWLDGEVVAGMVVGWNFGEGHLHDERLLAEIQERCGFEPGEVVVIYVESQPFGRPTLAYRIVDAARGVIEQGEVDVRDLVDRQPWSEASDGPGRASR